jgi:drug/metabolite transporter (DMT)-like permease
VSGDGDRRTALLATLALLAMTACWGSTFFLIKDLLDRLPVLDFLAVRFAIASIALWLLAPRALGRLSRGSLRHAVVLGLLYGVAQILQTAGLAHTPASVSGFITGMYVVCTPLFAAVLLRSRISAATWGAVALAMVGLGVLTLSGFSVGYGEAITFVSALLYALHIVGLGAWSDARQAMGMTIVQLIVITVVCLVVTAPDGVELPSTSRD